LGVSANGYKMIKAMDFDVRVPRESPGMTSAVSSKGSLATVMKTLNLWALNAIDCKNGKSYGLQI